MSGDPPKSLLLHIESNLGGVKRSNCDPSDEDRLEDILVTFSRPSQLSMAYEITKPKTCEMRSLSNKVALWVSP